MMMNQDCFKRCSKSYFYIWQ